MCIYHSISSVLMGSVVTTAGGSFITRSLAIRTTYCISHATLSTYHTLYCVLSVFYSPCWIVSTRSVRSSAILNLQTLLATHTAQLGPDVVDRTNRRDMIEHVSIRCSEPVNICIIYNGGLCSGVRFGCKEYSLQSG